ncbi:serine/threonine-protein kinase [Streptomyces cinnabarinus]|uniref:Serine/threonine-protein kinase n=1 Tax=Streptomyces cinnabarinus TaxID=67287 RepID=A0ABY7KE32_9ACTN|nr:serine/threonine-protein kinase [Streptomyces cinnabarinus]WAZ21199.1 serine/threonine-protein kinase [Streptomyces cinnabarinus]
MQALRETDPRRIGPYEVLGRLGAGGMGEVYLAEARGGVRLAVKVVRPEHAGDRTFRARFRQELRAARDVGGDGTYTARVVDADPEGEPPWMATEFVEGPTLRDAVLDAGPLPAPAVRLLAAALGRALTAIHARGLVHRDLKPSNILLAADGPRVIDFGIVRALEATALTNPGSIVGTVGYVSPEQIRNSTGVGPQSDVFALGAVLAHASGGRPPFGEGHESVVLLRILNGDHDLSAVPGEFRPLVESCLRQDPAGRPLPEAVMAAVGHTEASLRAAARPGWFTGGGARWVPGEDGERESGVEYVAPVTVPDAVVPPAGAPVPPSRRGVLRAVAGGAVVAAASGVGGWWWLREPERGKKDTPSAPATGKPAVRWQVSLDQVMTRQLGALSPKGDVLYAATSSVDLYALSADGADLWKADLGGSGLDPVATADGVYCTVVEGDSADGSQRLRLCRYDTAGKRGWSRDLGPEGTAPVLVGDTIVVGAGDEEIGELRAYAADGSARWQRGLKGALTEAPLVHQGVVYAGTRAGRLAAFEAGDGTPLWDVEVATDLRRPVVVAGRALAAASAGEWTWHGYSLDGNRLWRSKEADGGWEYPVTAAGSLALVTEDQVLKAFTADGEPAWTYRAGDDDVTEPAFSGGRIFVQTPEEIHALNLKGERIWRFPLPAGYPVSAPLIRGNRIYVTSAEGIAALDLTS